MKLLTPVFAVMLALPLALGACSNASAPDAVTGAASGAVDAVRGEMAGPPGGAMGGMGAPPQEAFDACIGQADGTSCTVNAPQGEVSGSCGTVPNIEGMLCIPEGGIPEH